MTGVRSNMSVLMVVRVSVMMVMVCAAVMVRAWNPEAKLIRVNARRIRNVRVVRSPVRDGPVHVWIFSM